LFFLRGLRSRHIDDFDQLFIDLDRLAVHLELPGADACGFG
jgi:hypothetical protein